MRQYFLENMRYPEEASHNYIQGKVQYQIVIDQKGYIKLVDLKSSHPYLEGEMRRVILSLPRFTPGMNQDVPVSVLMRSHIEFVLKY